MRPKAREGRKQAEQSHETKRNSSAPRHGCRMSILRSLLWGLAGIVLAFLAWRMLKLGLWLMLRPGGWIVLAAAVLIAVRAVDGGAAQAVVP